MSEHVTSFWLDDRFTARPWGVRCGCGWYGCFPDQAEAEEAIEHHKARWAEAEAKLRGSDAKANETIQSRVATGNS